MTPCKFCNKPSEPERYNLDRIREIMEEQDVCFHCAYWLMQHELDESHTKAGLRRGVVIGGTHYTLGDGKSFFKGFAGRRWTIRFTDGETVTTDDLWHQGEIPDHLRHLFPDNATFVND